MSAPKRRKLSHDDDTGDVEEDQSNVETATSSLPQAPSERTFRDLGIIEPLCEACENLGYKAPTPIQIESIPVALEGRDVIGLAETGSGKTAAYTLPILQALMDKPQSLHTLVMVPTRELAYQISHMVEALGSLIAVKCAVIVGGMDMMPQAIALGKRPHVVIATPGRLLDHLENTKGFTLRQLKYLVMDEADRLLDLDFGPIIDKILKIIPREGRKTYLFSATMSSKVNALQRTSLSDPVKVKVSLDKEQTVATLHQSYLFVPEKHKDVYLIWLLNELAGRSMIIFTRTVHETQRIAILLRLLGFSAIPLHGKLHQYARLGALGKFRSKSRDILVATDVAARGLDIPSVDVVLNFDLPESSKNYVHRVGRTARAGKSGMAISFVTQYSIEVYMRIETFLGKKLKEREYVKEEVMVFADRVSDAQREAIQELKLEKEKKDKKGKRDGKFTPKKRVRDDMDREER